MTAPSRHVVVATDERFAMPTATTLRSLSLHDPGPLTVWILTSRVSDASKHRITQSVVGNSIELQWVDMDSAQLGDTSRSPLGRASFFRLAIGEVLPLSVDRVLYMDTDMLVVDSLAPLWDLPDHGEAAWAVRSVHFPSMCTYGAMDHWPELNIDPRAPYFNSGLLMIDLARWRALDVGRSALVHLASPFANGALADQEALNVVLAGRWGELHPRWNQQTPLLEHNRGAELLYPDDVLREARENPSVIHFLSRPKPWHAGCTHPASDMWRTVAGGTSFAPVVLETPSWRTEGLRRIKRAASALLKGR